MEMRPKHIGHCSERYACRLDENVRLGAVGADEGISTDFAVETGMPSLVFQINPLNPKENMA
jgi:hypothetical protein